MSDVLRMMGEASTGAEHELEAVITRVPAWADRAPRYAPVGGGLTNVNWRVELSAPDESLFVKVPGKGTEAFIDRAAAHTAARAASALGISPRVVHFDEASGVEAQEFLSEHRPCNSGDFKNLDRAVKVIEMYRAFNSSPALPATKTVFDMIDEHLAQVRSLSVDLPPGVEGTLVEYAAAASAFQASGLDIVAAHNDPNPSNFLFRDDASPMKLIDFDYASNNERAYELGVFIAEMFFSEAETQQLVEVYYGRLERTAFARVSVCRAVADVKWGLWGMVNSAMTDGDFDYYRFGVLKLRRAALQMEDPRWGEWLVTL